jgi:hypothetical protein
MTSAQRRERKALRQVRLNFYRSRCTGCCVLTVAMREFELRVCAKHWLLQQQKNWNRVSVGGSLPGSF